jgi:hypothetical protein
MNEGAKTKRKPVWYFNVPATILVLFPIPLMSTDAFTYLVTLFCFSGALLLSYVSIRKRLNIYGSVVLLASLSFLITVCVHIYETDPNQVPPINVEAYP